MYGRTEGRTYGLSVILGFAPALNEPLRNNNMLTDYRQDQILPPSKGPSIFSYFFCKQILQTDKVCLRMVGGFWPSGYLVERSEKNMYTLKTQFQGLRKMPGDVPFYDRIFLYFVVLFFVVRYIKISQNWKAVNTRLDGNWWFMSTLSPMGGHI